MKHNWQDVTSSILGPLKRRCKNCGAEQHQEVEYLWMRVAGKKWRPLVGRCKPVVKEEIEMTVKIESLLQNRDALLKSGGDVYFEDTLVLSFSLINRIEDARILPMRTFRDKFMFYCSYAIASEEKILITNKGRPELLVQTISPGIFAYKNSLFL